MFIESTVLGTPTLSQAQHPPQNFQFSTSGIAVLGIADYGYSSQLSVAMPYVVQQRRVHKRKVRSAISATWNLHLEI